MRFKWTCFQSKYKKAAESANVPSPLYISVFNLIESESQIFVDASSNKRV